MTVTLERQSFIPFMVAVEKYGLKPDVLRGRIAAGTIEAIKTSTGVEIVAEHDIDKSLQIQREEFEHLRGQPITVSAASRDYDVPNGTLSRWAKAGYIKVVIQAERRGQRTLLDEADVAYCAAVYHEKAKLYGGNLRGVTIFDDEGNPYRMKNPEEAAKKREQRRQDD